MGSSLVDAVTKPANAQIYVQSARTVDFPDYARTSQDPLPNSSYPSYPDSGASTNESNTNSYWPQFWQQTTDMSNYNPFSIPGLVH